MHLGFAIVQIVLFDIYTGAWSDCIFFSHWQRMPSQMSIVHSASVARAMLEDLQSFGINKFTMLISPFLHVGHLRVCKYRVHMHDAWIASCTTSAGEQGSHFEPLQHRL